MVQLRSPRTWAVLVLVCFVLTGSSIYAQLSALSGSIKDPAGAVVPGATITIIAESGATREVISDDEGRYRFNQVTPGTYEVRAEMDGFKTVSQQGVRLLVESPQTLNLILELGDISEIVTVTSTSLRVANEVDATIGNAFQEEQITELPLDSRNVTELLSLQPGVDAQGNVAGARRDQSNLTLDGVDVNEQQQGTAFTPVLRVTPDSVQEFRVTVTNPNASQGRSSGGQVSLITKTGSNDWHGSLYEYHRNTVTSANDFFNNRVGIDTPNLLRNLYGGSVGGPIVKDKVFFFFNYEGRKDRSQSSAVRTVPLEHLGRGEVKYVNTSGETVTLTPDDIASIYPETGGINPISVGVFADAAAAYPANDSSVGDDLNTGGFRFNSSTPLNQNTWIAKMDFNLTDAQTLFVRGNYQWDNQQFSQAEAPLLPWLPGTPAPGLWSHPIGMAAGHTWTITPTFINTFRYGLTRQGFSQQGDSGENSFRFRSVFQPRAYSRTLDRTTPVHNFTNDTSWITGKHTFQFGTNIRLITNSRASFANAFDDANANIGFYQGAGATISDPVGDFDPGFERVLQNGIVAVLGRFSQYTANFNFGGDGTLLPAGSPASREFKTNEYEFYFEDSWQMAPNFTLNLGLRWGYNNPVNENTGFQVQPTTSLGDYFDRRVASANQGVPLNDPITVDVSGPFYDKPGYYDSDYNNFSPRVSAAWTPDFENGFLRAIFGGEGQSVFRGGYAITYDRIGSQLAVSFDLNNTLGFSSSTTIAAETYNVTDNLAPLFTGFNQDIRSLPGISTPDNLTFPLLKPSDGARRIESSLDDTITTPINQSWNFSIGRELPSGFFVEASYIGRYADNLLASRDIMHLNNLVDPASGQSWYDAARIIMDARLADTPITEIAPVPFFENLFAPLPTSGAFLSDPNLTPTQNVLNLASRQGFDILDWTFVQDLIDEGGVHPSMFFHPQYAAFSAFSTIANSNYHAFAVTLRRRFNDGISFDFNYTLSKSMDNASGIQTSGLFGAAFILNPLNPDLSRSVSDFNTEHIVNSNWLWDLPFGTGRKWGSSWNGAVDAILGGWSLNGVFRWNSGRPAADYFESARWATNWNLSNNVTRIRDPRPDPNKRGDSPNFWGDVQFAYNSFRDAYAGEVGDRNIFNRQSFVSLDFGLHKAFTMPYAEGHRVVFRWEVFNATNTQRLGNTNSTGVQTDPQIGTPPPGWGNIIAIQGTPRVMQFALRYEF